MKITKSNSMYDVYDKEGEYVDSSDDGILYYIQYRMVNLFILFNSKGEFQFITYADMFHVIQISRNHSSINGKVVNHYYLESNEIESLSVDGITLIATNETAEIIMEEERYVIHMDKIMRYIAGVETRMI